MTKAIDVKGLRNAGTKGGTAVTPEKGYKILDDIFNNDTAYQRGYDDGYKQALDDVLERVREHYKFFKTMPSIFLFSEMLDELSKGE